MSCAKTPSWNRRRGQGDRPRRRRHHDRIRFGAAFLAVVFELPLSDVTVVDGERAVLECRVAVTPAAEVAWYVDNVSDPADVTRERFDDMMPSTSQEGQAEWDIVVLRREGVRGGEVECEMGSIGRPAPKSSTRRTDPHASAAPLNYDDREMSAFYASQIDADVDASPAHRLVYVGDIIARHVTNQSVGDRIAPAATELCGQLELIAMTSRNAVSGNRRLAEKRTANTWTDTDTGSGDCGGLFR